ncbi:MAG: 2-oxoacid:acceptor oxidoreductase family protein, partial [Clostridia bacterium]|nr:2-oxoacid:acceptor oxidoreductase family protein [Clostridia bacterium]
MEEKIIIAGFGGQGVLSLGQFIAYAAIADGKEVTWLPSYGPEMRGGTSNCSVVVCDKEVASPIVARPDCLIAMNKPSLYKFVNNVKEG